MNHVTIWGSVVFYFAADYVYNYFLGGPYVGALTRAMEGINFWLTTLICVVILMLPVLTSRFYALDVNPSLADKIRMKRKMQLRTKNDDDTSRRPSAKRGRHSLRSGYAFAHQVKFTNFHSSQYELTHFSIGIRSQEGFGRLITSGKIMRKLPQDFAFPLGLGSKRHQNYANGDISQNNGGHHITNVTPAPPVGPHSNDTRRLSYQDLDTINL